jgi:hypothetical protein
VPGTVRTIADAYQEMPVTAVQDAVDALDVWANFDQLLSHKRSSSAVLLGSAPSLSKIKDATWQTISANADTWTINNAIIFASVVPIRFAHIEMNKLWAYKSAERNWIEDCTAKGRKTSLEQLSGTALITNRLHDCRVHRDDGDRMECTMKPGMEEIVHHPSKNEIVGTLARFGRMFTYERAQRWYPESDQKAWCKMNSTAMRWPREGELLRSCGASLTLVLDLLFHMQYERVYFLGFEMTSQEHFWQRDPRFQHLNWHKDLLTLEKKNETHKTAIEAVDKYVVDFGHFNNVDYFSCDRRSLFVKRGMPYLDENGLVASLEVPPRPRNLELRAERAKAKNMGPAFTKKWFGGSKEMTMGVTTGPAGVTKPKPKKRDCEVPCLPCRLCSQASDI